MSNTVSHRSKHDNCHFVVIKQASQGLVPAQQGRLRCLLQMGHLQGMLAEVQGWSTHCTGQ